MTKGKYYNPVPFPSSQSNTPETETETEKTSLSLIENVPGSTIKCTGKARIEPINPPAYLLEKLKKDLASNKFSPSAKNNKINRLTGFCSVCHGIPEYFMIYECNGAQKVERYCSSCLEKEKVRKYKELPTN